MAVITALGLLYYHGLVHTGLIHSALGKVYDCGQPRYSSAHTIRITNVGFSPRESNELVLSLPGQFELHDHLDQEKQAVLSINL